LVSLLGLALCAGPVMAQPPENPGQGASQGKGQGASQGKGQGASQGKGQGNSGEARGRLREESRDRDLVRERRLDREETGGRRFDRDEDLRFDERELRRIFEERREWISVEPRDSLPPGIRKNLERGKPLPPGIAKRFDDRLLRDLPRYEEYEWRHVGPDAVLVDETSEIIYRVLRDVLR
jgi:Ni/Co efflux regulator RcnB